MRTFKKYLLVIFSITAQTLTGQNYSGKVLDKNSKPIEFVNIGIMNKDVGTVSDKNGNYQIPLESTYADDTLIISSIGYQPFKIKVAKFKSLKDKNISLNAKVYEINEVIVRSNNYNIKILGNTDKSKTVVAGFKGQLLGDEYGILMKSKKPATLEKLRLHLNNCTIDTVFYRLNVYKSYGKMDFVNILNKPIYITLPKNDYKPVMEFDLSTYNIKVEGEFLVSLEFVKDLGEGSLFFYSTLLKKTYYRKTSQGAWKSAAIGVHMSVVARIEE